MHVYVTARRSLADGSDDSDGSDGETWNLDLFVNGDHVAHQRAAGAFVPAEEHRPLLGRNPEWTDRFFDGEVAFANVQHVVPDDVDAYARTLAMLRFESLAPGT